ncbi:lipid II:glycine glycyltransferase FemX [Pseudomonadota bacterium]
MTVIELSENQKSKYDDFVENHPLGNIHQLWDFGQFQTTTKGRSKKWVLALTEDENIKAGALIVRQDLPLNKCWLYCVRGPLLNYDNKEQSAQLFAEIATLASRENAIYLRIDPPIENLPENLPKSRKAHAHYQPESTLIIDLQPSEEEILSQMKPKGRYNIKVAKKHGVTVRTSTKAEEFYEILKETTQRDHFSGHPLTYYENMLSHLGPKRAKLYVAEHEGKVLAGVIATYFRDTVTYYFGASSSEKRNVMAPYLLHFQIMKDAKKDGYKFYDMFGIAPENQPRHAWAGVTDFKLKFGGRRVNYTPAREIIYNPFWYVLMKLAKLVRR